MAAVTPTTASGTTAAINHNSQSRLSLIPTGTTDGVGDTLIARDELKFICLRFDNVNGTTPDTFASGIAGIRSVRWFADAEADLCVPTFSGETVTFTHSANTDCDGYLEIGFKS